MESQTEPRKLSYLEFIQRHDISVSVDGNPPIIGVRMEKGNKSIYFHVHNRETMDPIKTLFCTVVYTLIPIYENVLFDEWFEWFSSYGYEDKHAALSTYSKLCAQQGEIIDVLGEEIYKEMIEELDYQDIFLMG
jgi:hypothetical protein